MIDCSDDFDESLRRQKRNRCNSSLDLLALLGLELFPFHGREREFLTATVGTGNPVGIFSAMGTLKRRLQRSRSAAIHLSLSLEVGKLVYKGNYFEE